jgi:hypothetical protein
MHRGHSGVAPFHDGIGSALDEMDARHRSEAHRVIHRVDARIAHEPVEHQAVLVRVDVRYACVMAFEMQARRGDDAV